MKSSPVGMTLVELLVTVFIFVVLTTMIVVNFQQLDRGRLLRENVTRVADLLREARVQTQAGVPLDSPDGGDPMMPPGGYGVAVVFGSGVADQYLLYADWDGNHLYDRGRDDVVLRKKLLDRNVVVTACKQKDLLPACGGVCTCDLSFQPPKPATYVNGDLYQEVEMRFELGDGLEHYLYVNGAIGQFEESPHARIP
ncbi:MAG: hypothetical protein AAB733_01830 [Patescibacteria group bacterium]